MSNPSSNYCNLAEKSVNKKRTQNYETKRRESSKTSRKREDISRMVRLRLLLKVFSEDLSFMFHDLDPSPTPIHTGT